MIFLIEYDRAAGQLVSIERFDDEVWELADDRRLTLELSLMERGQPLEIVLLQADSEADLRRTHRRYFERIEDLVAVPDGVR